MFIIKIDDDRALHFEVCTETFLRSALGHEDIYLQSLMFLILIDVVVEVGLALLISL